MAKHTRVSGLLRAALILVGVALAIGGVSQAAAQTGSSQSAPAASTTAVASPAFPSAAAASAAVPSAGRPSSVPSVANHSRAPFDVPILMYHLIDTKSGAGVARADLVVPPSLFEAQMEALARDGWHSITLEELGRDLRAGTRPAHRRFVVTLDDGHEDGYSNAWPILHRFGFVATYFVVSERIGRPGYMTAEQLRHLAAAGNEISDHSATHVNLVGLSAAELKRQVCAAAGAIAAITGHKPVTFAYPFGKFDQRVLAAVRACPGMLVAVTVADGAVEAWPSRLTLPRVAVGPETSAADLLGRLARYA
jgi:peptidoglycan/xylan/chitin deacetylase (PgdA/CDA1 family)